MTAAWRSQKQHLAGCMITVWSLPGTCLLDFEEILSFVLFDNYSYVQSVDLLFVVLVSGELLGLMRHEHCHFCRKSVAWYSSPLPAGNANHHVLCVCFVLFV